MLIRVLIFSTLVLAVNLVAGIFAKDQINQDFSPKNQHDFYIKGETPRISTLLRGSTRYTDSFGTQRDSTDLLKKPKIRKRFAREDGRAQGDEENNLTRLHSRRRSLLREEVQRTESQKSIAGVRRRYQRLKSADKSKESLEAEESAHRMPVRTPSTVSVAGLTTSSDNEDFNHENKTINENNNIFERREIRENETDVKKETIKDKVVSTGTTGVEHKEPSTQPLKTNVTSTVSESQNDSSSLRKRRPQTVIRHETQASPLPIASALTMSESLYNHFHPLDEDVPEDHRLPFLNFGKKLVPVSVKTTSPVSSSSSTRSTNSIEAVSTSPRTPPVGQYNQLSSTPQKVLSANTPAAHIPMEEEIHEDMDVSVMKSVIEKNKVSRNRVNSPQSLRNLGGLYRKQETSTQNIAANPSTIFIASPSSTENSVFKAEQVTGNSSEPDKNIRKKMESLRNTSTVSSTEALPIPKGTQRKSDSGIHSTTNRPDASVNDDSKVTTNLSSHHKYYNVTSQISEISNPASPTSQSVTPTQLSASSSRIEATVSTPFARGRPFPITRNITSLILPNRRPPHSYQHLYRHTSAASKSSKPPESTSKSNNISVYTENKTSSEERVNLTNTSLTTNSNEKSERKEFVHGNTSGVESKFNISEVINDEEKLIANPKERYTERKPLTKSNASLFEDTVNESGRNITSELSIESVTTKLITSTSPQSSQTNITVPTESPSVTTSIQSPTTKILSTAVVTSVSIKGAWPIMVTDSPPLEQTLIPPQTYTSRDTKKELLEPVLEPPGRYDTNRTQLHVHGSATPKIRHINISADGSLLREFPKNNAATDTSSGGNSTPTDIHKEGDVFSNKSSDGDSTPTSIHKEGDDVSKNHKFTAATKDITSNITETSHIVTENGQSNSNTTISGNKIDIDESSEPTIFVGRSTVKIMKETNGSATETGGSPDDTLKGNSSNPAWSPTRTSKSPAPKPVGRNYRNRTDTPKTRTEIIKDATHTSSENRTKTPDMATQPTLSSPIAVTTNSPASDSEFDFPLLKLYNASTVWSAPARGVTKSSGESSKSATEYPPTGNGSVTHKAEPEVNIMEATTREIGVVDEVTKATESVHATGDISEDESRKDAAGKDGEDGTRPNTEANVTDNSASGSSGGVNLSLGVGKVLSGNNTTTGSPRPGESVATTQGVSVAVYVISALGVVPLTIGIAFAARYCVRRRRKLLDDTDAYSDVSSRRGARNGGQTGSDIGSPVSGTKLPRVHTHLSWDQEKSTSTLIPVSTTRWEFPRSKLRLQTVLGQGNFGQVLKAEADDISGHEGTTRLVAVKTVKEGASSQEKEDLLRELEIMQQLGSHTNVVTLLGCCTEKEPYLLIMEYVMYGKLLAFLRDRRTRQHYYNFSEDSDALTSRDLTVFAYCVSRGMEYLASKGIIHRDLAARNVLVDHNKMCKIADFGMSRSVREMGDMYEQRHTKGALPIRWMAPESLHYRIFTHKSDVWSFGILMWEIVTLGSTPYPTMGAREVMRRVRDGYRLERPSHCRTELFRVISRCWHADPNKRPDFAALRHEIGALIEASKDGGGYVDLESFAESNKYSYSRSEDQSSHHYHHNHQHHHHPGSASVALGSRVTGDEEILNM